ncbi:MAG: family 16 glycosylhydrolase, partial [Pseudomonadota bacterium]
MSVRLPFQESFASFDDQNTWFISDFAIGANFIDTAWSADHVITSPGQVTLELDGEDALGKRFTGAEIQTRDEYFYGRYEVVMRPSDEPGVLSSFFVYTGAPFGDPTSEIDFEFIGGDTTKVLLTFHTPLGSDGVFVDLGFDAALSDHTYTFDWGPNSIRWYADGVLLREVIDPAIGIPAVQGKIFSSIWTGSSAFTGVADPNVQTTADYSSITYTPRAEPVANDDTYNLSENTTSALKVLDNDYALDTGNLTIALASQPINGTAIVSASTGEILYTPDLGFVGTDSFDYSITDANGTWTATVSAIVYRGDPIAPGADLLTEGDDDVVLTSGADFVDGLA